MCTVAHWVKQDVQLSGIAIDQTVSITLYNLPQFVRPYVYSNTPHILYYSTTYISKAIVNTSQLASPIPQSSSVH